MRKFIATTVLIALAAVLLFSPASRTQNSSAGTLSNNGAAAGANRIGVLVGIVRTDYAGGTAFTAGRDAAPDVGTEGLLHVAALPAMRPASYRATTGAAGVASAASATDIFTISGNATNTILLTYLEITCTETTAGQVAVQLIRRSTADSAGTSTTITASQDDSTNAAPSSVVLSYTANPTLGTTVANVKSGIFGCMAPATATANDLFVFNGRQKPLVLRGTAQQLTVNLNGATVTSGTFRITVEWLEITTITP